MAPRTPSIQARDREGFADGEQVLSAGRAARAIRGGSRNTEKCRRMIENGASVIRRGHRSSVPESVDNEKRNAPKKNL